MLSRPKCPIPNPALLLTPHGQDPLLTGHRPHPQSAPSPLLANWPPPAASRLCAPAVRLCCSPAGCSGALLPAAAPPPRPAAAACGQAARRPDRQAPDGQRRPEPASPRASSPVTARLELRDRGPAARRHRRTDPSAGGRCSLLLPGAVLPSQLICSRKLMETGVHYNSQFHILYTKLTDLFFKFTGFLALGILDFGL